MCRRCGFKRRRCRCYKRLYERRRKCCGIRWDVCGNRGYRFNELQYFDTFNLAEAGIYGNRCCF